MNTRFPLLRFLIIGAALVMAFSSCASLRSGEPFAPAEPPVPPKAASEMAPDAVVSEPPPTEPPAGLEATFDAAPTDSSVTDARERIDLPPDEELAVGIPPRHRLLSERIVPPEQSQIQRERLRLFLIRRPLLLVAEPRPIFDPREIVIARLAAIPGVLARPFGTLEEPLFELRVSTAEWAEQNFDNFYGQASITYAVFDPIEERVLVQRTTTGPPVFSRISTEDAALNSVRRAWRDAEPLLSELRAAAASVAQVRGLAYRIAIPPVEAEAIFPDDLEAIAAALHALGEWNGLILHTALTPPQLFSTLRSFLSESGYDLFFDFGTRTVEIRWSN